MSSTPSPRLSAENRFKGRAVSRGIASGRVVLLHGSNRQFFRSEVAAGEVEREVARFGTAVESAKRQLAKLAARKSGRIAISGASIFAVQGMLLEDPGLFDRVEGIIREQRVNAEWALKCLAEDFIARYKTIDDENLRERFIDIEDVAERVLASLSGQAGRSVKLEENSVIAARELKPSTLIELAASMPVAVITENGGWTSHTFILARELGIPAVTGIRKLDRHLRPGDEVVVDGFRGRVILNPRERPVGSRKRTSGTSGRTRQPETGPARTLDGVRINLLANSDLPSAIVPDATITGLGIGLYRSEFLFNQNRGFPSESEQVEAYTKIADVAGDEGVKIRTFDLGAEQALDRYPVRERNPALGLRALRLGLAYPQQLRTQLRALLRASHQRRIDIILPMVSGVGELREVRRMLVAEKAALRSRNRAIGDPGLGVMIELPAAVLLASELSAESDFVCLGTNDLIQYLLAADRENEAVADWYRSLHPAVVRAVGSVIKAGIETGKRVIVCGEMAGSPFYVPVLIGLGATDLSMNIQSMDAVRRLINGLAAEECRSLLRQISAVATPDEAESITRTWILENWAHLLSGEIVRSMRRNK